MAKYFRKIECLCSLGFILTLGWSGGAKVLGKLPVPGRPTIWITVGQGPTALAVSAGGVGMDIFTLIYPFFPLSPSLWETARYRLKYCLKGPLNLNSINQSNHTFRVVLGWAYRGLTGGFLLLQNFCVAISVSPHVCFILVLILISMFLG